MTASRPRFYALVLWAAILRPMSAAALEVSLEENKAERGSIGYVDMQKVFKLFPETRKAKANFAEMVRQAELEVNKRKTEILTLRAELSRLTAERDLLLKTPIAISTAAAQPSLQTSTAIPSAMAAPAAVSSAPAAVSAAAIAISSAPAILPVAVSSAPAPGKPTVAVSSASPKELIAQLPGVSQSSTTLPQIPPVLPEESRGSGLIINLPGATTGPIALSPPEERRKGSPPEISSAIVPAQAPVVSTAAVQPAVHASTPTSSAQPPVVQAVLSKTKIQELEDSIASKQRELGQKEADFKDYQDQEEKNLIDLESRRTEILLGKIYKIIQDVARENGVSVVVDKSQILFGHNTVDLTAKVLKRLEGVPL